MALFQFLSNQLINIGTRGKPTWENEEEGAGAKLSAWVPDVVGDGPGFFLNPLGLAAEISHLLMSKYERTGYTAAATREAIESRLSGPMRAADVYMTRSEGGRALRGSEVWPAARRALVPVPISGRALAAAAEQVVTGENEEHFAGEFQKQLMASAGVKTDQAPSDEQRMRRLAQEFNREHGVQESAEFFAGDFTELTGALRRGNRNDIERAMTELLTKRKPDDIIRHYQRWANGPFTGQRAREAQFLRSLGTEQRQTLAAALRSRSALADAAIREVRRRR
jgi:hypothetical protein